MVERGDCTIFVAGDRARAEACQPIFDAIAKKTHYVGDAGMASLAKLATNSAGRAQHGGTGGGARPRRKRGFVTWRCWLKFSRTVRETSKMVEVRGPLMASRRFDAQMRLDLFLKDFKLMLDEGLRLGVPLPLTSVTQQLSDSHRHRWTRRTKIWLPS